MSIIFRQGERNINARLKAKDVEAIIKLYNAGLNCKLIAQMYKVDPTNINHIVQGKTWKHITDNLIILKQTPRMFTVCQVRAIKLAREMGLTYPQLANQFNCAQSTIAGIVKEKSYREITI